MTKRKRNARARTGRPMSLSDAQAVMAIRLGAGPFSMILDRPGKLYDPFSGTWKETAIAAEAAAREKGNS